MKAYPLRDCRLPERSEQLPLVKERIGRFSPVRACPRDASANRTPGESRKALAAAKLGLVGAAYLTVYPDSRLVELSLPMIGGADPPVVPRGDVCGLSDDSRRRLMRLLHKLKRSSAKPAFVHLTFPDDRIPATPREAKVFMFSLFKRWKRRNPELCGIWRMEAHPGRSRDRGFPVPHFHLLVWNGWIDRYKLSWDWAEIVNAPDFGKHLRAGTRVESIETFRGVCYYASKYVGKEEEYPLGKGAGRVWGLFHRDRLPIGSSFTVKLDARGVVRVARFVRQLLWKRGVETEWMPRAIYLENPLDMLRAARLQI